MSRRLPPCRRGDRRALRNRVQIETLESRRLLTGGSATDGLLQAYGQIPLSFEANQGQTDGRVQFLSRGAGYALFVTPTETVLSLQGSAATGAVLRMQLVGASAAPTAAGLDRLPGVSNYLTGNDPSQWQTNVPNFARVQEQGVYPGVDLTYYGNQRQLEYDFTVAPGADPGAIRFSFQGADSTAIDAQGNLVLHTAAGDVVEHAPVLYQESGGVRQPVSGRYVIGVDGQVGFAVGTYDAGQPLVIDPTLGYSTYLGGTGGESGAGIAVDAAGDAYVTGQTFSIKFPTTPGAFKSAGSGDNFGTAFVTKIAPGQSATVTTTTALSSSTNPSTAGQSVVLTATVTGATGTPTGTVTFTEGTIVLGTRTLDAVGKATLTTDVLAPGTDTITASYGGDASFTTSSGTATQTVNPPVLVVTRTTLTSSPDPSTFGQVVNFTATVDAGGAFPDKPDTVTFTIDGVAQPPVQVGIFGPKTQALFSIMNLGLGAHSVTATYNGSPNTFAPSTSAPSTQTVIPATVLPTITTLAAAFNPAFAGEPVSFTATVLSGQSRPGEPDTVTFTVDGVAQPPVVIGRGIPGVAVFTTKLTAGPHAITATYNGSPNQFAPSTSAPLTETVNPAPPIQATTLVLEQPGQTFSLNTLSLSAILTGPNQNKLTGIPTGTVTFVVDGKPFPSPFTQTSRLPTGFFPVNGYAAGIGLGTHTVSASYSGDANFAPSAAAPVTLTVVPQGVGVSISASPGYLVVGQPVTLSAAIDTTFLFQGSPAFAGNFVFQSFVFKTGVTTVVGQAPADRFGKATLTVTNLPAGENIITAQYVNDPNYTNVSNALSVVTVNPVVVPSMPVPVPPAPAPAAFLTVVSVRRYGYHLSPTTLVVSFSGPLDRATAENPRNYRIQGPDTRYIPVGRAAYDPRTHAVTLHPRHRLDLHKHYMLTVVGSELRWRPWEPGRAAAEPARGPTRERLHDERQRGRPRPRQPVRPRRLGGPEARLPCPGRPSPPLTPGRGAVRGQARRAGSRSPRPGKDQERALSSFSLDRGEGIGYD